MEKAYDFKILGERLKAKGVDLGKEALEDGAMIILDEVFPWLTESAKLSEMPYDDMFAIGYPTIHAKLKELADQINPADNV